MPPIFVLILAGVLLGFIAYLSLQLYISRRILEAFQRSAVVVPAAAESGAGLKSGLFLFTLIVLGGLFAALLLR